jgi:hypothetical protein
MNAMPTDFTSSRHRAFIVCAYDSSKKPAMTLLGKSSKPSCHFCISTAQDSYNVTFISILHLRFNILDYSIYFENNTKQHFLKEILLWWKLWTLTTPCHNFFFMKLKDGGPHQMKCLYRCTYPLYCSVGVYFLFWGSKARDARIKKMVLL